MDVKIDEFIADLAIEGTMPVTGAISLVPSGKETTFQIDKVAIYRNTMLVGYLSGTDLKAFKMIKDGSKNITITQKVEGKRLKTKGTATVEILKGKARLLASMRNGTPHYEVLYHALARMTNNDSTLDFSRPQKLLQLESELSDKIRSEIEHMLRKLQHEFKSDALGFGTVFHRQHPQQWKHLKRQWNEIYPDVQVDVKARITIERMGRTEAPGPIESAEAH